MNIENAHNHTEPERLRREKLLVCATKALYEKQARSTFILDVQRENRTSREERFKVIERLKKLGFKTRNASSSLYINGLSPVCAYCAKGAITISFTNNCSRNCFYCYRPSPLKKKTLPFILMERQIRFENQKYGTLKSFAVTGGEPLFAPDKVCRAFSLAKKITDNKCQTCLYTNGDLLTAPILKRLKRVGLDEIRFGLNDYSIDFDKLAAAREYIPRVMLEIPVMPDHEERVKKILIKINKMRIFGINLKEMNYVGHNTEIFRSRGYFLKMGRLNPMSFEAYNLLPLYPIFGSEETCFNLMEFAARKKISVSVHYCSVNNKKHTYLNVIKKCLELKKKPHEAIARNGLLKAVAVYYPEHMDAYRDLRKNNVPTNQITIYRNRGKLLTHPRNLKFLDKDKYSIAMLYYTDPSACKVIDMRCLSKKRNPCPYNWV